MIYKKLILLCGLVSISAYAANPAGLVKKGAELSKEYDLNKTIEASRKVDLSNIDFQAISESASRGVSSEVDLKGIKEELIEVVSDPNNTKQMNGIQAIAGVADENHAIKREEALNLLGLSETRNHLYVFISYSMPEAVIKAYAREAMWAGATLVVKGLEEGETIEDFMNKKANPLIKGKGYTASMNIDPRLFDAFNIEYVPTTVLAEDSFNEYCKATGEKLTDFNITRRCEQRPEDSYIKISGNLTLDYILEQFEEEGTFAESAAERLASLRSNIGRTSYNTHPDKFEIDESLQPFQKERLINEYSKYGTVVDDEHGLSVIPFEPPKKMGVHYKRHQDKKEF